MDTSETQNKSLNGNKQRQDDWRVGRFIRESAPDRFELLLIEAKEHEVTKARRNLGLPVTDSTENN